MNYTNPAFLYLSKLNIYDYKLLNAINIIFQQFVHINVQIFTYKCTMYI